MAAEGSEYARAKERDWATTGMKRLVIPAVPHLWRALKQRPLRLVVVPLLGAACLVVAWFVALSVDTVRHAWPEGIGEWISGIMGPIILLAACNGAAVAGLVWLSVRLWKSSVRLGPRFLISAFVSRTRHLLMQVRERPIRLLACGLFVVGSLVALHITGTIFLVLLPTRFWPPWWDQDAGPLLLCGLIVAAGAGLVWLSLRIWEPRRRVHPRFLLWLMSAAVVYAIGFIIYVEILAHFGIYILGHPHEPEDAGQAFGTMTGMARWRTSKSMGRLPTTSPSFWTRPPSSEEIFK